MLFCRRLPHLAQASGPGDRCAALPLQKGLASKRAQNCETLLAAEDTTQNNLWYNRAYNKTSSATNIVSVVYSPAWSEQLLACLTAIRRTAGGAK